MTSAGKKYGGITAGTFIERPNRFIAIIDIAGRKETVHVKNTGRCRELLVPGAQVYVEPAADAGRKTRWSLIAVKKGGRMVNIDSQVPNELAEKALRSGKLALPEIQGPFTLLARERTYGASRFDLYFETLSQRGFIEVKGVTLESDGVARFPDAPTERGTKHINELVCAVKEGYTCYVLFVIQMKGLRWFEPNVATDPAFGFALKKAWENGVKILAVDCNTENDFIEINGFVRVDLL